jgi:hypothetical protein
MVIERTLHHGVQHEEEIISQFREKTKNLIQNIELTYIGGDPSWWDKVNQQKNPCHSHKRRLPVSPFLFHTGFRDFLKGNGLTKSIALEELFRNNI